jgi:hypothetical protein
MSLVLDFDVEDMDALGDVLLDEPSIGSLRDLTRSISGQYSEVIAGFVRHSFRGEDVSLQAAQVRVSVDALRRLAEATEDPDLTLALAELDRLLPESSRQGGRARERYLREMRAWVLRFAALLGPRDGDHLLALVSFDDRSEALLHRLMEVYGVGPRRLERLYCAGLFSVDSLINADPVEVAQVTGMSVLVGRSLIHAAELFDRQRRRVAARELLDRTHDVVALAKNAQATGRPAPGLHHAMQTALVELNLALNELVPEDRDDLD